MTADNTTKKSFSSIFHLFRKKLWFLFHAWVWKLIFQKRIEGFYMQKPSSGAKATIRKRSLPSVVKINLLMIFLLHLGSNQLCSMSIFNEKSTWQDLKTLAFDQNMTLTCIKFCHDDEWCGLLHLPTPIPLEKRISNHFLVHHKSEHVSYFGPESFGPSAWRETEAKNEYVSRIFTWKPIRKHQNSI